MSKVLDEKTMNEIYEHLNYAYVGKDCATSAWSLASFFHISERKLREYISEIRRNPKYEKIVCSCNGGYYICTEEESDKANKRLYSQAFSLLKTARENDRKAGRNGQMRMAVDEFLGSDTVEAFGK